MGRPLNKKFFGDTLLAGQQIRCTFRTGGTTYNGYIVRARGQRKFLVRSADETVTAVCRLKLVNNDGTTFTSGTLQNNGEMTFRVFPNGSEGAGGGAVATVASLKAVGQAQTTANGSGYTSVGEVLTAVGGTYSVAAAWTIAGLVTVNVVPNAGNTDSGFSVGDTITIGGTTCNSTALVARVASLNGAKIGSVTITTAGVRTTSGAAPTTNIGTTAHSSGGSITGVYNFDITWGVYSFSSSPSTAGVYTAVPANPVSFTDAAGAGAQANISFGVNALTLVSGGSGYTGGATVSFSGDSGSSAAVSANVSGGVVTGFGSVTPGSGYTALPAVTIIGTGGSGAVKYPRKIDMNYVVTTDLHEYKWFLENVATTLPSQANIESA